MSKRRVVITGLGIVSPVGNDVATAWAAIVAGRYLLPRTRHFSRTGSFDWLGTTLLALCTTALLLAVSAATGLRMPDLPMSPPKVRAALDAAGGK